MPGSRSKPFSPNSVNHRTACGRAPARLLVVLLVVHQHEIALYENGTFLAQVGPEEILRLTKVPHLFELQLCRVQGLRRDLFDRVAKVLDISARRASKADSSLIWCGPCAGSSPISEYTRETTRLELAPRAVRDALLQAREPGTLLFQGIPKALVECPLSRPTTPRVYAPPRQRIRCRTQGRAGPAPRCLSRSARTDSLPHCHGLRTVLLSHHRRRPAGGLALRAQNLIVDLQDMELKALAVHRPPIAGARLARLRWQFRRQHAALSLERRS